MQHVEQVEKCLLRTFLASQELDVIDQQHVNSAVLALEFGHGLIAESIDVVVGELFTVDIPDANSRIQTGRIVADGMQQVSFTQTRVSIDKQRLVCLARRFGHSQCSCVCHTV